MTLTLLLCVQVFISFVKYLNLNLGKPPILQVLILYSKAIAMHVIKFSSERHLFARSRRFEPGKLYESLTLLQGKK